MFGRPPVDAAATAAVAASSAAPRRAILRTCSSLSRVIAVGTRKTSLRIAALAALAAIAAAVAIGWSGAATSKAAARHIATVQTRKIKNLGVVLVNSKGRTLYMFVPDKQKKVTCKGSCAIVWPPLKLKKGQKPTAGGAAKKKLLGLDGRVVTYNRWPLYTYIQDKKPGQATGQGINNSGGKWYVLTRSGKVLKR
jgi:predicted lipoprotein with Yx(FWY)xxD motif